MKVACCTISKNCIEKFHVAKLFQICGKNPSIIVAFPRESFSHQNLGFFWAEAIFQQFLWFEVRFFQRLFPALESRNYLGICRASYYIISIWAITNLLKAPTCQTGFCNDEKVRPCLFSRSYRPVRLGHPRPMIYVWKIWLAFSLIKKILLRCRSTFVKNQALKKWKWNLTKIFKTDQILFLTFRRSSLDQKFASGMKMLPVTIVKKK